MNKKLETKAKQIAQSPTTHKVLLALKPDKSIWGFLGIVVFLIVPEIIAFIWGIEISTYAQRELIHSENFFQKQYYEFLIMLFEEGGSWFNLAIGMALLIWFFF